MEAILWGVLAVFAASFAFFFVLEWRASRRRFALLREERFVLRQEQLALFRREQPSTVGLGQAEQSEAA